MSISWEVGADYYIKNPRIAEIFDSPFRTDNWTKEGRYFYIEMSEHFIPKDGEVFEK
jgi:hypothetical protein